MLPILYCKISNRNKATSNNRETVYIPLEDVESEHCAIIVEKGLAKIDGVESPKVEFNNLGAAVTLTGC